MLALVDADYKFIFVEAGANGRAGDAAVFRDSALAKGLESQTLNVPSPSPLPGSSIDVPSVSVGDDAFLLKDHLIKPHPSRMASNGFCDEQLQMKNGQQLFNYRLSRARRVSESSFGLLTAQLGVFKKLMATRKKDCATHEQLTVGHYPNH